MLRDYCGVEVLNVSNSEGAIVKYRTGANNGRSWIGAALEYRPQFLDQKIFFCIKASLNHKPQKKKT